MESSLLGIALLLLHRSRTGSGLGSVNPIINDLFPFIIGSYSQYHSYSLSSVLPGGQNAQLISQGDSRGQSMPLGFSKWGTVRKLKGMGQLVLRDLFLIS